MPESESDSYALTVSGLHKRFGSLEVLKGVSLLAREGDVISILGSSGSGKSTLLRCINLLETPDEGVVTVAGETILMRKTRDGRSVPADRRQVDRIRSELGMVFQSFNLWSHMTILENLIEAPIHVQKRPRAECVEEARALLDKVGIGDKANFYPDAPLRRPAAARRDRPRAGDEAEGDAVRRADLGARPRTRRRSPQGDALARRRRAHHADRHPRNGLRRATSPTASSSCTRAWSRTKGRRRSCSAIPSRSASASSSPPNDRSGPSARCSRAGGATTSAPPRLDVPTAKIPLRPAHRRQRRWPRRSANAGRSGGRVRRSRAIIGPGRNAHSGAPGVNPAVRTPAVQRPHSRASRRRRRIPTRFPPRTRAPCHRSRRTRNRRRSVRQRRSAKAEAEAPRLRRRRAGDFERKAAVDGETG